MLLASQSHACTVIPKLRQGTCNAQRGQVYASKDRDVTRGSRADSRHPPDASLERRIACHTMPAAVLFLLSFWSGPATRLSLINLHHDFSLGDQVI